MTYVSNEALVLEGLMTVLTESTNGLGLAGAKITSYEIPVPDYPYALISGGTSTDTHGDASFETYVHLFDIKSDPETALQEMYDLAHNVNEFLKLAADRIAIGVDCFDIHAVDSGNRPLESSATENAEGDGDTLAPPPAQHWITLSIRPIWLED